MELDQLQGIVTIAQERSFSRLARLLHIAQPALSRKIKNLDSNWTGQVSLAAASTSALIGSLSAPTSWTSFAIAVAPAVNGGTASCNNNPIEWIAPHTVSGFCRMTLGGHAPNS